MILLIDNYDSFTYNLYHLIAASHSNIKVVRNDQITIEEIEKLNPAAIFISPGPCTPNEAGVCLDLIRTFIDKIPIFGVCLGHQSIGQALGGKVIRANEIVHGKPALIYHHGKGLFEGLPSPFPAGRYHSLIVEKNTLPDTLECLAETKEGLIMALKHKKYPCYGVQFHPESILTPQGSKLIENFFNSL